jgi:capsular exopolysaccharide synthesis family protein
MDLKELITLYRRRFWLLLAGLALGLISGFVVSELQSPIYEAATRVLITRSRPQGIADVLSLSDQQLVLTYQQLLKTRPLLNEAESRLGIKIDQSNIKVSVVVNTQIIEIKVQDKNAEQASDIANALVQILIEQNETLQAGRYAVYEESLNTQIAQVQEQINNLQGQITQINQASVDEQLALVGQQIADLQDQISTLEKDIAKFPALLTTADRASLSEKQTQLDQLRSLLYLYQQIQTNLTFIGRPVQNANERDDPQITSLQSTLNLYQDLYLNLLNDLTAVKMARVESTPTVSQIEAAVIPESPVRPVPLIYTALSGILGLFISSGAILLIDYFDDTLRSSEKISQVLDLPVLGEITDTYQITKIKKYQSNGHGKSLLLNAFGILRINVNRLATQGALKTILITSPSRGEGKTTIAMNLAAAFIQSGRKVVLLDADLLHPALHQRFGLDNDRGLHEILMDDVNWHDVVHDCGGISVITSGGNAASSTSLLESKKMSQLLRHLQTEVDFVIVDGPPLFIVDSQILASRVGGILLVIRRGDTLTAVARAMLDQLKLIDANVLGVVLNRVPPTETYYFDGKYNHNSNHKKNIDELESLQQ